MAELDRRDFLKLVGASAGAATTVGCSDPVQKLIPYVIQPEEITPGISVQYASTCRECPAACGLHVKTREGRPIKLEGNPDHPINRGRLCARGQSAIARTYHPDRHEGPMMRSARGVAEAISWEDAHKELAKRVKAAPGKTWVLGGDVGDTLGDLIDGWVSAVGAAGRLVYEPFGYEALRAATKAVFGVSALPVFDLSSADLVIDLGSDFIDTWISPVEHAGQLADARDVRQHPDGGARLVSVGPRMSLTASNSDQWIPAAPGSEGMLALALAAAVIDAKGGSFSAYPGSLDAMKRLLRRVDPAAAAKHAGIGQDELDALARRLLAAKSPVVLPPGVAGTSSKATATTAAILLLDAIIGAVGSAVQIPAADSARKPSSAVEIQRLIDAMQAGKVDVLLIHDSNPVHSLAGDSGFAAALGKVDFVVSFAALKDETSQAADLVLPDHTPLESWGDVTSREGVRSLIQPTVRPLWNTQALGDTLLAVGRELGADMPQGSFRNVLEAAWSGTDFRRALDHGGIFTDARGGTPAIAGGIDQLDPTPPQLQGSGDYVLIAYPQSFLGDGRGAALPWLQEIPDPVTKASWSSWAEISPKTAKKLGVGFGDVIAIETGFGARKIEVPVYPRGGVRDDVVAVAIGQGHTVGHYASRAGDGMEGVARGVSVSSVLPATTDESGGRVWLGTRAKLTATGAFRRIALSQWTDNQRGRGLAQEVSLLALAQAADDSHAKQQVGGHGDDSHDGAEEHGSDGGHGFLLPYDARFDADPESPYRWAMAIDTDRCNGCSACVAACSIENNIPVVGQDGATRHREMTWIRIERYIGDGDREGGAQRRPHPDRERLGKTDVRHAPMLCQQCGAAPCEAVCPSLATYHSTEGINAMIYNRCLGTRYCANNCTYKVRRFNYFDYSRENWPGLLGLMLNPDVTVRAQGVMEKCTFCVQRIEAARQPAKDEGRTIADGEVQTACQQSCPTNAISFGNLKDADSRVTRVSDQPARAYHSLQTLNTRPAITYLAQVNRETGGPHG